MDYTTVDFVDLADEVELLDGKRVIMAGIINKTREYVTKNRKIMCFMTIEDLYGEMEVIVFPDVYLKFRDIILEDEPIYVYGQLQVSDVEDPKMILQNLDLIEDDTSPSFNISRETFNRKAEAKRKALEPPPDIPRDFKGGDDVLYLRLEKQELYSKVRQILIKYPGEIKVVLYFADINVTRTLKEDLFVDVSTIDVLAELVEFLGQDNVKIVF